MNKQKIEEAMNTIVGCLIDKLKSMGNIYCIEAENRNVEDVRCIAILFDYCHNEKVLESGILVGSKHIGHDEYGPICTTIIHREAPYTNSDDLKNRMLKDIKSLIKQAENVLEI